MSDSDTNDAIIELTQLTQSKCYCPQCSVLEKLNPPMKSDLACGLAGSRTPNSTGDDKKRKADIPSLIFHYLRIMLAYALIISSVIPSSRAYASIIRK